MPLTKKQRLILEAILFLLRKGELPTVREVGALVGLRSPSTVLKHLRALEAQGWITISGKSRGIRIADPSLLEALLEGSFEGGFEGHLEGSPESHLESHLEGHLEGHFEGHHEGSAETGGGQRERQEILQESSFSSSKAHREAEAASDSAFDEASGEGISPAARGTIIQAHFPRLSRNSLRRTSLRRSPERSPAGDLSAGVPLVGAIAAGCPIESRSEAFRSPDPLGGYPKLAIDPSMFATSGELVALKVEGDSMIEAGILDGDYVIIRRQDTVEPGEIAAVIVDGEVTLKRWCPVPAGSMESAGSPKPSGPAKNHAVSSGAKSTPENSTPARTRSTRRRPFEVVSGSPPEADELLEPAPEEGLPGGEVPRPETSEPAVRLLPANERFPPLVIRESDRKEVIVFGKYVGLVRGDLRTF